MGAVHLTVSDLDGSRAFYEQVVGLRAREREDGDLELSGEDGRSLIQLHGAPSAPRLDRRATGLFHLAMLLPTRLDLAFALARLSASRWPLDGASDHLVSEALYLSDPDGNGIEIYRDRPREDWVQRDGQLQMDTLALDLRDVAGELAAAKDPQPKVPAGTTMGHVHLQVSELEDTERFYSGVLGFDVTVRGYPGALFVSAGGYHHHVGLNTWNSAGSGPPVPGAIGLRQYEVVLPEVSALDAVLARAADHDIPSEAADELSPGARRLRDPSGNAVVLRTA
ncbi:MAG: catechol 2,3-dioxygenase [Solirubrobacteraceae bacterium]|jgi:catechol 2,3-dioxygenase|nr:catechol 2,3-dioxygenase [Solirubrobacteraceae bacterium]